jgi:hypothetical protein
MGVLNLQPSDGALHTVLYRVIVHLKYSLYWIVGLKRAPYNLNVAMGEEEFASELNVLKFEEGTSTMMSKEEYENRLEEQLEEWSSRIYMLEVEAERQGGKDRSEHQRRIKEILDQKAALEKMIAELKNASGKKWIEIKDEIQEAQADFEASFKTTFLEVI